MLSGAADIIRFFEKISIFFSQHTLQLVQIVCFLFLVSGYQNIFAAEIKTGDKISTQPVRDESAKTPALANRQPQKPASKGVNPKLYAVTYTGDEFIREKKFHPRVNKIDIVLKHSTFTARYHFLLSM